MLGIFFIFLLFAFYQTWEEQYEKADAASKASDSNLHQTHEYQERIDVLTDNRLTSPVSILLNQLSPDDYVTIQDISVAAKRSWSIQNLLRIKAIVKISTNETVKKYGESKIEELVQQFEKSAADQVGRDEMGKPKSALIQWHNRYDFALPPNSTNASDIVNIIAEGSTEDVAVNFLALREKTGVNFPMFDFDAVNDWSTNHNIKFPDKILNFKLQ